MLNSTNLKIEPAAETQVNEMGRAPHQEVFTALDSNKRLQLPGELIAAVEIARWPPLPGSVTMSGHMNGLVRNASRSITSITGNPEIEIRLGCPEPLTSGSPTIRELMTRSPCAGTDPTITSGSPVTAPDQRLLWRFGKLRAAPASALQSPRCCI